MNQHNHSLSIIIPVYNEESTLLVILKKIEIINKFCDLEIIIINDGSTDNSKKIIDENNIKGIVIGYPINMDGTLGPSAQSVSAVSKNIDKNVSVDVCLWD